jgi:hypothetical protein
MPDISITDFTDFILKVGPPKITKVAELHRRMEYIPAHDFWKPLRDQICDFHEGKNSDLSFASTGAHSRKQTRYEEAIKGYKKFLKEREYEWFKPHRSQWLYEDLAVRINPEVGMKIGSKSFLIKLYFKQETLTNSRVQLALSLMHEGQKTKGYTVAILDVVRSRLHSESSRNPQMKALLNGEAATFLAIWNSLSLQDADA